MTRSEVEARVKTVLIEMFELDETAVTPESHLYEDLDLDSLDAIDLAVKLKVETDIKLTEEEMKSIRKVADITEIVWTNLQSAEKPAN
jgi:acyl carrier protein